VVSDPVLRVAAAVALLWLPVFVAVGFHTGAAVAESENVTVAEMHNAFGEPVEWINESEYERFKNSSEDRNQSLFVTAIDRRQTIVPIQTTGHQLTNAPIAQLARTILFPAWLAAPWGHKHPDLADPAIKLLVAGNVVLLGGYGLIARRRSA